MPIDKALNLMPSEAELIVEVEQVEMPDVEIVLEEDGSAVVEIGADEASEVGFYDNLADVIDPETRSRIAIDLQALFEADKSSRQDWENMYSKGLELLGLKIEERTKPFRGAAGAVHPMLTEAIVQFQSQALKELMPAGGPVRTQILGKETLEKAQQAARVQDFMNYQITTVMKEYTPEFDQLLFYTGYGGSSFKKVYYDEQVGRMVSKLVLADDLYIPYYGSSVMSECPRITHRVAMDSNEFRKRVVAGEYLDIEVQPSEGSPDASQIQYSIDKQTGLVQTGEPEELFLLEFHVNLDIEGFEHCDEDGNPTGIKLPYVVTIDEGSGRVLAIRRNWIEGDKNCCRRECFVHYVLVEGLGAYGLGFVHLIGGLSKTATAALRQLLDAGTLANLPAGFKAKGARITDDDSPLQPGEWRDIDAGGAELSSSLLPLPYKEPSQVLFQLLGFTVEAGKRLASIADMQVGDANQMAAVGTTLALLEKGSMVMSAIHKRLHYAQKLEFEMLAKGFADYLPDEYPYSVPGADRSIKCKDFNDMVAILPVADPNIFSTAQRITLAQTQLQLAQSAPQMHNMYEAYYRVYQAMNVRDIDGILRPQSNQMPKDPSSENGDVLDGMQLKAFAGQQHDAHIVSHLIMGMSPLIQANPLAAAELQKHILQHIRLKAEETTEAELFTAYGVDPDRMVSAIQKEGMIAIKCAQFLREIQDIQGQLAGGEGEDPIVALKQQELEQRAAKDQADIQNDQQQLQVDKEKIAANMQANQARIASQENIAALRADVARERAEMMLIKQQGGRNAA
jgi:chaperonin GroES